MGNSMIPRKNLDKFLKDKNEKFSRKKLIKLGFGVTSGAVIFNILLSTSGFAHGSTAHVNVLPVDIVTELSKQSVPDFPKCWRIVPTHVSTPHGSAPAVNTY